MKLHLTSMQVNNKGIEIDKMELITEAKLIQKDKFLMIDYDETLEGEKEIVKNRIRLYPDKMTITRVGEFSSNMSFKVGDLNKNYYTTPYGELPITTETLDYKTTIGENKKGDIYLKYKITFEKNEPYYNIMNIIIS